MALISGLQCTEQVLEAKRLLWFGEQEMQLTEFPLPSQEELVKWDLVNLVSTH